MENTITKDIWGNLVKKTKSAPFFLGTPAIKKQKSSIVISQSLFGRVILLILFGIGITLLVAMFFVGSFFESNSSRLLVAIFFFVIGALLTFLGVYHLFRINNIFLNLCQDKIIINFGYIWAPQKIILSREELTSELAVNTEANLSSAYETGSVVLTLHKSNENNLFSKVATTRQKHKLTPVFEELATYLKGENTSEIHGIDKTFDTINLTNDQSVTTSTLPLDVSSGAFKTMQLLFTSDTIAKFKSTKSALIFQLGFLVLGLIIIACVIWGNQNIPVPAIIGSILLAGLFIVFGFGGVIFGFGEKRIVADIAKNILVMKLGSVGSWQKETIYNLDEIAAVQICIKYEAGSKTAGRYIAYQLNVILIRPAGERVNITSHGNEASIRKDARKFADFIKKPLLDHTQSA